MDVIKKRTKKIAISVSGVLILIIGLVMLITPGPGWLLIIMGLGILAPEYAWAHNLLDKAKKYYESIKKKALSSTKAKK